MATPFVHATISKWCICLRAVLIAGFGGRSTQYLVRLVEGCSIGTVLNVVCLSVCTKKTVTKWYYMYCIQY
jgi:hypothetical protein